MSTATAAWAGAIRRAGERVTLARPDGTLLGETWAKLTPMAGESVTDTASGARYKARLSPTLLPTGAAALLSSIALTRRDGETLRAFGVPVSIRQGQTLLAYELTVVRA